MLNSISKNESSPCPNDKIITNEKGLIALNSERNQYFFNSYTNHKTGVLHQRYKYVSDKDRRICLSNIFLTGAKLLTEDEKVLLKLKHSDSLSSFCSSTWNIITPEDDKFYQYKGVTMNNKTFQFSKFYAIALTTEESSFKKLNWAPTGRMKM